MKLKFLIFLALLAHMLSPAFADKSNKDISFYLGTFDVIDKEGDDQSTLLGMEHRNPDLFRDTPLGKFSPVSGGFMTGDSSVYLYTGIEGIISIFVPHCILTGKTIFSDYGYGIDCIGNTWVAAGSSESNASAFVLMYSLLLSLPGHLCARVSFHPPPPSIHHLGEYGPCLVVFVAC